MRALSAYPFRFEDTGAVVGCSPGTAATKEALLSAVRCLLEDELLTGALQANPEPSFETTKALPRWAKQWRKEMSAADTLISTEFGDNGISYYFVVAVSDSGVRGVYRHAEFWPN